MKRFTLFTIIALTIWGCESGSEKYEMAADEAAPEANYTELSAPPPMAEDIAPAEAETQENGAYEERGTVSYQDAGSSSTTTQTSTAGATTTLVPKFAAPATQKIIRTAEYKFKVKDVRSTTAAIEEVVGRYMGYVAHGNLRSETGGTTTETRGLDSLYEVREVHYTNEMVLRVPNGQFAGLLDEIARQSVFTDYRTIKAQDVTEEYMDIQSRLRTKREVEARYIEILRSKAKTIEEVLRTEEQLRVLREEIEAAEGRLNFLQNQVGYSTINLSFYQDPVTIATLLPVRNVEFDDSEPDFFDSASSAFLKGWDVILRILVFLIGFWPLWLFVALVGMFIRRRRHLFFPPTTPERQDV